MRTPLLALFAGSLLIGCTVGDTPDGGDDDGVGGACGDGTIQSGEACDDGNTAAGDGCSATCTVEANPRLTASLDKTMITTELGKTEIITLTLTSVDGFAGTVQVAPSFAAGANPITNLTAQGPTSINVAAGATVPTQYSFAIPSNFAGADVNATLKFGLTSSPSAGLQDMSSALTIGAIYTVAYAAGLGTNAETHPGTGKSITVRRGTKLRFKNLDTITHITHGQDGFAHEVDAGGLPNNTYELNTIAVAPGTQAKLGCHSHGSQTYATFTIAP
jgi:cysteine-rich repeat protein